MPASCAPPPDTFALARDTDLDISRPLRGHNPDMSVLCFHFAAGAAGARCGVRGGATSLALVFLSVALVKPSFIPNSELLQQKQACSTSPLLPPALRPYITHLLAFLTHLLTFISNLLTFLTHILTFLTHLRTFLIQLLTFLHSVLRSG